MEQPQQQGGQVLLGSIPQATGDGFTQDGTVDLKGRPVLRSEGGGWKACSFLVAYEILERFAYFGLSTNLILYLTTRLHQGTVTASNNVTNWVGTVWLTPILGAYVADAHLGRYRTFMIGSTIYFIGMCIVTLSVTLHTLKPSPCPANTADDCHATTKQVGAFFLGLYVIALGAGATKSNISTMGFDQFDSFDPKEHKQKLSFFTWWIFCVFFGNILGNTFLVYIQDNVWWGLGYGIPTAGLALSTFIFLLGTPFYRHRRTAISPFGKMAHVLVAAARKRRVSVPSDLKELHELDEEVYSKGGRFRIEPTSSLQFLNKAAVKVGTADTVWSLCPVTHVEETKRMVKMIPIFLACILPSTLIAQGQTLFIKQGLTLDRRLGPHFKIPAASMAAFINIPMLITLVVYNRWFVPAAGKRTGDPRGISLLKMWGAGMFLQIIMMIVSVIIERERLAYVNRHGLQNSKLPLPLSFFILLPQCVSSGIADALLNVPTGEFFYDQAPANMKSIATSYFTTSIALGNYVSSFLLKTVSRLTATHGRKSWITNNLNNSHLDYYYLLLTGLGVLNFVFFLIVSKCYVYNPEETDGVNVYQHDRSTEPTKEDE